MLKIYGSSDDNVVANIEFVRKCPTCGSEIDNPASAVVAGKEDEVGCYNKDVIFTIGSLLIVEMSYGYTGVWAAHVRQAEENSYVPWAIAVGFRKYSALVTVNCPIGTSVEIRKRESSK